MYIAFTVIIITIDYFNMIFMNKLQFLQLSLLENGHPCKKRAKIWTAITTCREFVARSAQSHQRFYEIVASLI